MVSSGWKLCEDRKDRELLSELIEYNAKNEPPNLDEKETLYKAPPENGVITKLLWIDENPVGFYILRLKGPQEDGGPLYLHVIDGVFIKKDYRKQGWGIKMLEDAVACFPNENLGFSQPISYSLKLVILKFLRINPQCRDKFWAIENCGEEGDRLSLWFSLCCLKTKPT